MQRKFVMLELEAINAYREFINETSVSEVEMAIDHAMLEEKPEGLTDERTLTVGSLLLSTQ
tara:strand:- start:115 stop:297 length:183 start_codon:yes stop_codon:yes gene_type:complete